jgi:hypothetical protein
MLKFSKYLTELFTTNRYGTTDPEHFLDEYTPERLKEVGSDHPVDYFAKINNSLAHIDHHLKLGFLKSREEHADLTTRGLLRTSQGLHQFDPANPHEHGKLIKPSFALPASAKDHAKELNRHLGDFGQFSRSLSKRLAKSTRTILSFTAMPDTHKLVWATRNFNILGDINALARGLHHSRTVLLPLGNPEHIENFPYVGEEDENGVDLHPVPMREVRSSLGQLRDDWHNAPALSLTPHQHDQIRRMSPAEHRQAVEAFRTNNDDILAQIQKHEDTQ